MKIAININELTLKQNTGVKIYTREIVKALREVDKGNKYLLYKFKIQNSKFKIPLWTYTKFPQEIKRDQPAVLFMPIQSTPFLKKPKNIKLVITVHDLAFLLFPKHFTFKNRFLLNFHTKRAIKMADKIITPSETTKRDIIKFYNINEDKIKVVYHGVNSKFKIQNSKFKINTPYILFVGSIQPRKNLVRLIEAFEILKNPPSPLFQRGSKIPPLKKGAGGIFNINLIIVGGKGWLSDKIYKKAKESEFSKDIIFKGNVSDDELANLYKNASIFVMPSLYEGFGLPVLEAMSYGVPCVVSDNSSLREIANKSTLFVDACSSTDIAKRISNLLNNKELRKELSKKGIENAKKFSWKKSARETLTVLENA